MRRPRTIKQAQAYAWGKSRFRNTGGWDVEAIMTDQEASLRGQQICRRCDQEFPEVVERCPICNEPVSPFDE